MGFVVYVITFVSAALGFFISGVVNDEISVDELAGLSPAEINGLITGLLWFLVCFVVYLGTSRLEEASWFKLLTPSFFITWAFVCGGIILGSILFLIYQDSSVTIDGDVISFAFFNNLAIALGPTASASLGIRKRD